MQEEEFWREEQSNRKKNQFMGSRSREKKWWHSELLKQLSAMKIYSGGEIIEKDTGGEYFSRPLASNSNVFDSNVSNNDVFRN